MVIDDATGLEVRIDGNGTDILEAALFEILCDFLRNSVTDRNLTVTVPLIKYCFFIGIRPET